MKTKTACEWRSFMGGDDPYDHRWERSLFIKPCGKASVEKLANVWVCFECREKAAGLLRWSGLTKKQIRKENRQTFWAARHPTRRAVHGKEHYVLAPTPPGNDRGAALIRWLSARDAC